MSILAPEAAELPLKLATKTLQRFILGAMSYIEAPAPVCPSQYRNTTPGQFSAIQAWHVPAHSGAPPAGGWQLMSVAPPSACDCGHV